MTYIILNPNGMVPFRRILYIPMKQNKIRRERNWLKLLKSAILWPLLRRIPLRKSMNYFEKVYLDKILYINSIFRGNGHFRLFTNISRNNAFENVDLSL